MGVMKNHPDTKSKTSPYPELLSRRQVAARLSVSIETIKRMQRRGLLQPIILNARLLRYRATDIDRLISEASAGHASTNASASA